MQGLDCQSDDTYRDTQRINHNCVVSNVTHDGPASLGVRDLKVAELHEAAARGCSIRPVHCAGAR